MDRLDVRYWEATGRLAAALRAFLDERAHATREAVRWAKRHGAAGVGLSDGFGTQLCFHIPDPGRANSYLFRPIGGQPGYYLPRRSSREGKALAAELERRRREFPSRGRVAKLIGFDELYLLPRIITPGLCLSADGARVLLATEGPWEPAGDVAPLLTRISDLDYEAATADPPEPRGRERAKKPARTP